jgi:hypothetical protein
VIILSVVAFAMALAVARLARGVALNARLAAAERGLRAAGPVVCAVASAMVVWFVWGEVVPVANVQDESSYLLQAQLFASGRWTAPSPPMPEFFEQPHVLVVPAVASKYPPGHALLLSIGALVHFPPLVPLLLTALSAALLFVLAARVSNVWVAVLASLTWISAPIVLRFQPSYLSELTTTTLVLLSWWLLLEWRDTQRTKWLMLLAAAIGWGAITRPLTMLAFAIPIGVVVVRDVVSSKKWKPLLGAVAIGTVILGILPLWSARTTGNWRLTPLEQYRRDYLPFDKFGFTPDTSPPRRGVPPALQTAYDFFRQEHVQQRVGTIPRVVVERAINIFVAFFQGARLPLLVFAAIGWLTMGAPLRFATVSALLLFVFHIPYAHWAQWTLYYLETAPVLAVLTATGAWWLVRRVAGDEGRARVGSVALATVLLLFTVPIVARWRRDRATRSRLDRSFAAALARLPSHSILFVHYTPRSAEHLSAVSNYPDLNAARVWVVHDLGARNEELKRLAPDRTAFDFEEDQLVQRR